MKLLAFPSPKAIRSIEERNALVEAHLHLVPPIARRLQKRLPPSFEVDDLISIGNEGLIAAAACWSPERNSSFEWFAKFKIDKEIHEKTRRRHYADATMEPIKSGSSYAATAPVDDLPDQITEKEKLRRAVAAALNRLSPRHRAIAQTIMSGNPVVSISDSGIFGVGSSRMTQLKRELVAALWSAPELREYRTQVSDALKAA